MKTLCKTTTKIETDRLTITEEKQNEAIAVHQDIGRVTILPHMLSPSKGMEDPFISASAGFCVDQCVQFAVDNGYNAVKGIANVWVVDLFDDNSTYRIDVNVYVGGKERQ